MSKQFDDTNRGALFKNERKTEDQHADYNGSINVAGHDYWLNAWIKTSKAGKKFMSLSVKQKDSQPAPKGTERQGAGPSTYSKADTVAKMSAKEEMDDEIPW
jgi:hypothetical protein